MAKICTIYEVRYFYAGLAALGRHKGALKDFIADGAVRDELTRLNNDRSRKYNLPERSATFRQTPYYVLYELRQYGLVQTTGQGADKEWVLTTEGWRIYDLLKNSANGPVLKQEFARLMLSTFPVFTQFINILNVSPHEKTVGIPHLAQGEFEKFEMGQSQAALEFTLEVVANLLQPRFNLPNSLYDQFRQSLQKALAEKLSKNKKLSTILDVETIRFFTTYFFEGTFTNQVQYEVVRTRAVFLGFANYYREGPPHRYLELIYPTCRLQTVPAFSEEGGWESWSLAEGFLALPAWQHEENSLARFVAAIKHAYQKLSRPTGYAEVADLRDQVCFDLRIPDYFFDELLKQCVVASQSDKLPVRIYLDSSLSQPVTALKRAPLELKEGTFNLIRIHSSR